MSKLESVEKLRKCATYSPEYANPNEALRREFGRSFVHLALEAACDEIEREVAGRYMELPTDADGEPIRLGDLIGFGRGERLRVTHVGRTGHGEPTVAYRRPNGTMDCSCIGPECRHVGKPTVEDLMHDYALAFMQRDGQDTGELDAEYAARLREAMGE